MEPSTLLRFPNAWPNPIEHDVGEIDLAIALVACGVATRVHLVGLIEPDAAAAIGLAHAQQGNIAFSVYRNNGGGVAVIVGPRD